MSHFKIGININMQDSEKGLNEMVQAEIYGSSRSLVSEVDEELGPQ